MKKTVKDERRKRDLKKKLKRIKRCRRRRGRWGDVTISTSPGEYRGVAAHPSAPAHHLQSVQTSCSQAGENTAVSGWTHFLQVHKLSSSLEHTRGSLLRVLQRNLLHEADYVQSVMSTLNSTVRGDMKYLSASCLWSHLMMLFPPCCLSVVALDDTVERQVVDVDVSVWGTPGEGQRGGVGRREC